MSDSEFDIPSPLPQELESALRHALNGALVSFSELQTALRRHVRTERSHGAQFAQIEHGLRAMVSKAEGESAKGRTGGGLCDQVVRWSATYFDQSD
jgi:hypothetical protein